MKIAVGLFYLECDTFNYDLVTADQFTYTEGERVLDYINVGDYLRSEGIEIVPTIMASALPAGRMRKADFLYFENRIMDILDKNRDVDGVFFHLHGSMEVDGIGSGDLYLLKDVRRLLGYDIPVGIVLDAHANNDPSIAEYANVIRGYHTIPHVDQPEAELEVVKDVVELARKHEMVRPCLGIIPAIVSGEKGLTSTYPLCELMKTVSELEARKEIMSASIFMGEPWCDCPNSHMSVVVVPAEKKYEAEAREACNDLWRRVFSHVRDFSFEVPVLPPDEVIARAVALDCRPVFISDAGDNTTGGAMGHCTEMLRSVLNADLKGKKILITPVLDPAAFELCSHMKPGDSVELSVGTDRDDASRPVRISGHIKSFGDLMGYLNCFDDVTGHCVTIEISENVDLMISDVPTSLITHNHFVRANVTMEDYDVIILKQGYLFAQLRPYAKAAFMALSRGATYLMVEDLEYKRLARPIHPFDPVVFPDAE